MKRRSCLILLTIVFFIHQNGYSQTRIGNSYEFYENQRVTGQVEIRKHFQLMLKDSSFSIIITEWPVSDPGKMKKKAEFSGTPKTSGDLLYLNDSRNLNNKF